MLNNQRAFRRAGSAAAGYTIKNSVLISGDSFGTNLPLMRTPAIGNQNTWTFSTWVKLTRIPDSKFIFTSANADAWGTDFAFNAGSNNILTITWQDYNDPGTLLNYSLSTIQQFRDISAWYHFVFTLDNRSPVTEGDRARMYINGERVTDFSTENYPNGSDFSSSNFVGIGTTTNQHIGSRASNGGLGGYMAETVFLNGTSLDADNFGEFDDNGIWNPINLSELTFDTNSFHLNYESDLGTDVSGNGNDFTPGTGDSIPIQTADTPTDNTTEGTGNYATMNPLDVAAYAGPESGDQFSNGNKTYLSTILQSIYGNGFRTTIGATSGKWYWEVDIDFATGAYPVLGILSGNDAGDTSSPNEAVIQRAVGKFFDFDVNGNPGNNNPDYGTFNTNDTLQFALDLDVGGFWIGKNGAWLNDAISTEIAGGTTTHAVSTAARLSDGTLIRPWIISSGSTQTTLVMDPADYSHTAPEGFKAWSTANLPTPAIAKTN